MASPSRNPIYSQGGAVFIGDGNAGRDIININHITTVKPLARSLHQSLFTLSHRFTPIQKEIASLLGVLESITGDSARVQVNYNEEPAICSLSRDCHEILKDLGALKHRYQALPAQTQLTWERCEWDMEELRGIRARLMATMNSLNMVYSRLIHSSTTVIMQKLETFIDEVRTGKREGSIVSNRTMGSLSADDKEAWRQLRKELESAGITTALFSQHRALIIERLLKAIDDGDLVEYSEEELPEDIGEELPEDTGEELSSISERSIGNHLTTAIPTFRLTPKIGTGSTKTSATNPSASRLVQRRRWVPTTLFRLAHGNGSLLAAVKQGDADLVRYLLQKGARVNLRNHLGATPLLLAAEVGHEAIVKQLLETDEIDVNCQNQLDNTPLHFAATNGHEAVVEQLLDTGKVNIGHQNVFGDTVFHRAAKHGHEAVVKQLLTIGGTDINRRNHGGSAPLHIAAQFGNEAVFKQLLGTGEIDINLPNSDNATPLNIAAKRGHEAIVQQLLERSEIDINLSNRYGETPLHTAALFGNTAVIKQLCGTGRVNVNDQNSCNVTPLYAAAERGHTATVKKLLKIDEIDINLPNWHLKTPLFIAAENGHKAVVKQLLDTGRADVSAECISGKTPLSFPLCEKLYRIRRRMTQSSILAHDRPGTRENY